MKRFARFGRFWFEFVVGDDPILAIGVAGTILAALALHADGPSFSARP